jgi:3-oxoacyl-[acyl-carrier protein] reductase
VTLEGKVAVITGGSNGIGAATARDLAAAGARVAIGYNKGHERAEALAWALPGHGHTTFALQIEDGASVRRAADEIRKAHGRCDILINAASFTKPIPHANLDALDDATMDMILIANARGPFAVIRALAPLLKQSGDGVIVNISSISAFTGSGSNIAYCMAKAALDTMTLSRACSGRRSACSACRRPRLRPISSPAATGPRWKNSPRRRRSSGSPSRKMSRAR